MKVAILMPWVGGPVPPHLGYTCASMAGGARTSRLLLIHEKPVADSLPQPCHATPNVDLIELEEGGVGGLHGRRIGSQVGNKELELLFQRLFRVAPNTLAEFKPTWGYVFDRYLTGFTHWTYTDVDVAFGNLDGFLAFGEQRDRDEAVEVDVETWAFSGDAGRLFLRGQWALHRRDARLEKLWMGCAHLSGSIVANLEYKLRYYGQPKSLQAKRRERAQSDATGGGWDAAASALAVESRGEEECTAAISRFVSAEACYSCVVFSSARAAALNVTARVSPYMLTDHSHDPIWWYRGSLARCQSAAGYEWGEPNEEGRRRRRKREETRRGLLDVSTCVEILRDWRTETRAASSNSAMRPEAQLAHTAQRRETAPVALYCTDMRWICRSAPHAALHVGDNHSHSRLGFGDGVLVVASDRRRRGVVLVERGPAMIPSPALREAPLFHFRIWIDYGTFTSATFTVGQDERFSGFAIHERGFQKPHTVSRPTGVVLQSQEQAKEPGRLLLGS